MKHFNITVTGKVQGVFFRRYTENMANQLGVKGLVRNEEDGAVFIEAEGNEDALLQFISWCYTGSPHSKVDLVKTTEGELKYYTEFRITK